MAVRAAVRVEQVGRVRTVILSRPEVRNAVDGPTAGELLRAFEEFETDDGASVAVVWGGGGDFCGGGGLEGGGTGGGERLAAGGGGAEGA
ncbi:enoyl-CoA hydratase, partial [Streptomyces tateyamensis]